MPQKPDRQPPPQPAIGNRRILVVDDSHDSADSLAALDIGLPRLDGYETCRRIREQPWGKDMVIVALTGRGQDEDRQLSTQAGFDGHLVKPVDHAALNRLLAAQGSTRG